jgi:hypothetical protein
LGNGSGSGGETVTDIAERVKFWEEQQRINSLLVPRVVELSKTSARSLELVQTLSASVQATDAKASQLVNDVRADVEMLRGDIKKLSAIEADTKRLRASVDRADARLDDAIKQLAALADLRTALTDALAVAQRTAAAADHTQIRRLALGAFITADAAVALALVGLAV